MNNEKIVKVREKTNKRNVITNDNGNLPLLADIVSYPKIELQDYEMSTETVLEIYLGGYATIKNKKIIAEEIMAKEPLLLVSLLNLYESLPEDIFINSYIKYLHSPLDEDCIEKIIAWCEKFGYPYEIDTSKEYKQYISPLFGTMSSDAFFWFPVAKFLVDLRDVYKMYSLYDSFKDIDEETDTDKKAIKIKKKDEFIKFISTITFTEKIEIGDSVKLNRKISSLFDVAKYQIVLLYVSGSNDVRQCRNIGCNTYFIPKPRNVRYCSNPKCYKQARLRKETYSHKKTKTVD